MMAKPITTLIDLKIQEMGQKKIKASHTSKIPSLRISTQVGSFTDHEESQFYTDSLSSEECSAVQLIRRTADLKDLILTKPSKSHDKKHSDLPFGPKTRAFIIPAKNFEIVNIEMDPLENYNIWSDIGRGSYAVVKFATQKVTGQKLAIKIYEKQKIQDPMRQKSINREVKIMKLLKHQNIVELIEDINAEKNLYLVMEYVQGFSLQAHIMKQPWKRLEEVEAAEIFGQFMQGLAYCHRINISHRDIKLENVLINKFHQIKLIDFGFSTISATKNKKSYIYCGTPNYMAPEIIKKIDYAGPPVDIWASGVLLYTIVTGVFPFSSTSESKVFKRILRNDYKIPDYISYSLKQLISQMLQPNPELRFTAEQIIEHNWVKNKGKIPGKAMPLSGDSMDVIIDDDNFIY
ncbi:hypothetical protein SteCoe_26504 [Stentor coeruleus]|uniref:Protein kinase domain-containing protein n=1 Tax=Stentor coeruleus TaxID=5963 RepID=A0A1R2BCP0_9CILI|nr:hypothetical protein SteCoe_26504 [Stentor coeruleus]